MGDNCGHETFSRRELTVLFRACRSLSLLLAIAVPLISLNTPSANAIPGVTAEDAFSEAPSINPEDAGKTFDELLLESSMLLRTGRPIDARAKLQQALKLRPNDYRPHMLLGQYYLFNVAHFKLAYRYLATAEKHFARAHGSDLDDTLDLEHAGQHAMLLYLLSEAQLNLDMYQESLATLDRFEKLYWLDWYPGTRAWVLMKLKRIDEAVRVAQAGLLKDADPRRTWNILGILLSVKGNRELSLNAFQQAIRSELEIGGSGMIATPLNNAGEVYREMFQDQHAEGAWLRAVRLPDGCEHVLPSLNLANLYIDQIRLFQAERVLKDFEVCFAADSLRKDTEHRSLLALARGKIRLMSNDIDEAFRLLRLAAEEEQWFGKIGTNENDVKFAANVALARALEAKAAALRDRQFASPIEALKARAEVPFLKLRAWWLNRKARRIALEELDDLEDLFIRNTDSMVAYPTLGNALAGFNPRSFAKRISRMLETDDRQEAHPYYRLYLAENLLSHGKEKEAEDLLRQVLGELRPADRLARAEALAKLLVLRKDNGSGFFGSETEAETRERINLSNSLFELLPSHLRFHDIRLPVTVKIAAADESSKGLLEDISERVLSRRFEVAPATLQDEARYGLAVTSGPRNADTTVPVSIHLMDRASNRQLAVYSGDIGEDKGAEVKAVNEFISKAFAHRMDPPGEPVPPVPILEGLL